MSIKMSKENICINQIIGEKEEKFVIEGDEIVPDIKPDVLSIISSNGTMCIYKKEIMNGKVKLDGSIYVYTLYIADDEISELRSINSSLDFSKTIEIKDIKPEMQLKDICEIKSVEAKILNGRKISLKANVEIKLSAYANENIDIIKDVEEITDMQRLDKTYNVNSLIGSGSTKAYAKETISIDEADNLSEIIKTKINIVNKDIKISYNKVLAKADADVKIVYLTEDNRISIATARIPIMGFIDIPNVKEENICDISYELKNISVKPNNIEEHSIYVEAEIEIATAVYETKTLNIIQDLYSPSSELEYNLKPITIMQNQECLKETCNIRNQEKISAIGKNRIYDVEVKPTIISTQAVNGRIMYEGEVSLVFLYETKENSGINSTTLVEPFSFNIANQLVNSKTKVDTTIDVVTQDFIVMPDESIDIKIDLEFSANIYNTEEINIINEINKSDNRYKERYSIVIYYTKEGDTLWNIAKKFGSTVDEIVRTNKIENPDVIIPGEQLFIPR